MRLLLPVLALGAVTIAGCANSGNVSPLVFCDRPSDFDAKVFTDCTPRVGGDSPARSARDSAVTVIIARSSLGCLWRLKQ